MVIIAGKEYMAAEKRDEYLAIFEDFIRQTRNEPGCLDLIIAADPIENNRINNFELWASQEQLDAFRARANPPESDIEVWGDEVKKYEISASGPPFP